MNDDSRVIDKGWDALPDYANKSGDADDAVTVSVSTTPGEWLVNTIDAVVVPMSMAELVEGLRARKLTERSLVWRAGMQEWSPVDNVPQLKLAAGMLFSAAPSPVPPRPSAATATPSQPPSKPIRASTPAPHPVPPQTMPSRRSTLPFGLPTPVAAQSRPGNPRPASSPRHLAQPPPRSEDAEALAVYERPAATISFDLSPAESVRVPAPERQPETLAPLTTDSARRRMPLPRNADLSVVAASDFRQVQRSSKRLVWISSLASAAAASLLTFWLARGPSTAQGTAATSAPSEPLATVLPTAPAPAAPSAVEAAAVPSNEAAAPTATTPTEVASAKPPKPSHRAKAVNAAVARRPTHVADTAHTTDPGAEPNPYDVKLDEEAPAGAAPAPPHSVPIEADGKAAKDTEASTATGSSSPGF